MTFSLNRQFKVFNLVVKEYLHTKRTRLIHIKPLDDLKLKGLLIKLNTFPMNDTGIFHILEHVVLCGSRNYKIRDPFMKLVQRNLALDMNACTAQDMTYYYALTDHYKEIRDIYMDAILFPALNKFDFMQEGHYFDKQIKGVVYNEMKGAMSDINSIYYRGLFKHLFPNTIYQYNSGGDPSSIPSLNYDFFTKTHKQFYHPSNMTIVLYGDLKSPMNCFIITILSSLLASSPCLPYLIRQLSNQLRRISIIRLNIINPFPVSISTWVIFHTSISSVIQCFLSISCISTTRHCLNHWSAKLVIHTHLVQDFMILR
eukprot:NODE_553_length_6771_cov_0.191847.p3 type:complete len:314 gc:universal NODE_553_length_6771_cov_0.191847:431-1372(+)